MDLLSLHSKVWATTDTHFDHENIGVWCDRPDGWQDRIIKFWKDIVKPQDTVIHLGDVQVGRGHALLDLLSSLPGTKVLIIGNHDTHSHTWYMRNGFAFAADAMAFKGVTLTHHPAVQLFPGTDINVHGHVHNSPWKPKEPWQRLLAIEHTDFRPVDFQKWCDMARSPDKWTAYMRKWPIPCVKNRKSKNGKLPKHDPHGVFLKGPDGPVEDATGYSG